MSNAKDTVKEIEMLVAEGETEKALLLLKQTTEAGGFRDRKLYKSVLLLVGQFNTWERNRMKGLESDQRELTRISDQVLNIADELLKPPTERVTATPPPPPPGTSPDPLRMAQTYQPPAHPRPESKTAADNPWGGYLKGFLIVSGAILVIAVLVELISPTADEDPGLADRTTTERIKPGPDGSGGDVATPVSPAADLSGGETTQQEPSRRETEPRRTTNTENSTQAILSRMMEYVGSGQDLSPADLREINYQQVSNQLGGTTWYYNMTGSIYFDEDGLTATYLNGYGQAEIISGTRQGFYIANYVESGTGDSGFLAIVPPFGGDRLHLYVESTMTGNTLQYVATRQ